MAEGLEGIVVGDTELSYVDGGAGVLIVRGLRVEELAGTSSFEAVVRLLLDGVMPDEGDVADTQRALGAARARAFEELTGMQVPLRARDPMSALRGGLASVGSSGDTARPHAAAP